MDSACSRSETNPRPQTQGVSMDFTDRLEALRQKLPHTSEDWLEQSLLFDEHADALLAVVKAAQETLKHNGSAQRAVEQSGLRQALRALEKE